MPKKKRGPQSKPSVEGGGQVKGKNQGRKVAAKNRLARSAKLTPKRRQALPSHDPEMHGKRKQTKTSGVSRRKSSIGSGGLTPKKRRPKF